MHLAPLTLSADPLGWGADAGRDRRWGASAASVSRPDRRPVATALSPVVSPADAGCAFCGVRSGSWAVFVRSAAPASASAGPGRPLSACPLCALSHQLDRPRIDDEAALIWLPEMSQQAVNVMMRDIHMRLRNLREPLEADRDPRLDDPERRALYHSRAALGRRAPIAVARLGTGKPSELASALLRLSRAAYDARHVLLGGVRLLPLGRLYEGDQDVYPRVVDTWRRLASLSDVTTHQAPSSKTASDSAAAPGLSARSGRAVANDRVVSDPRDRPSGRATGGPSEVDVQPDTAADLPTLFGRR